MSTFLTIQTAVIANLAGRNDTNTLAQIMTQTNFVQALLASAHDWQDLQTTATSVMVIDQWEYTPANLGLTALDKLYSIQLQYNSYWEPPMKEITHIQFRRDYMHGITANTGRPTVYARFSGKYRFAIVPDYAYPLTIDYLKKPTAVTGNTSELDFSSDLDGLIIALVTGVMWLSIGERENASTWLKLATPMIENYNIDSKRIMNMITPAKAGSARPATYNDPFKRN